MIIFEKEPHKYTVDGEDYPSVTQILEDCGLINTSWYSEESAQRGIYVHEATQQLDENPVSGIMFDDDEIEGYIDAYLKFKRENEFIIISIERMVANKKLRFAGRIDRIGILNGQNCILDIKTGQKEKYHGAQLSGYKLAYDEGKAKLFGLYLKRDGNYKLLEYKDSDYRNTFMSALNIYHEKYG